MKVLLLSLPAYSDNHGFPLGIGYLVGSLQQSHDVKAYHYDNKKTAINEIQGIIKYFRPHIIGMTCNSFNRGCIREFITLLKSIERNVAIVVGGVHATFCYDQMLTEYGADIVVIGEGENTFKEMCNAIQNKIPLSSIRGIAYKENGKVILTSCADPVKNIDDLPMPDYSYAQPFMEQSKIGYIITSRGCPVRCNFCSTSSYWGQRVRMYSASRVVDEMEMLISKFKVEKIFFHDDTFNLGTERVKAICKEIMDRKVQVDWACSCRVTPVSEEMIACMVEAGCRHICWGIESGSEEILKRINKKITLSQIRNAYELSNKSSNVMSTGAFTMVGNPGESYKTIQDTVTFLNSIPMTDCPSTSILYVLPGTLLYEDLKKEGYIRDESWYKYDTVPSYTLEHSLATLSSWAKQVSQSGLRIPFEPRKHFWYGILETSDVNVDQRSNSLIEKIIKIFRTPHLFVSRYKKLLPGGRIRF